MNISGVYCEAETAGNATWAKTATGENPQTIFGTCLAGFKGNPSRTCSQDEENGVWGTITEPCEEIACEEREGEAVDWPRSLPGIIQGICKSGYSGNPSRNCTLVGDQAFWQPVQNPCIGDFLFCFVLFCFVLFCFVLFFFFFFSQLSMINKKEMINFFSFLFFF